MITTKNPFCTIIDKKKEIATPEFNLFSKQGKNTEFTFSDDRISSDRGLLLFRELDEQLKLLSSASNCILDERDYRYVDHSVKELLTQRIFQIAAGYKNFNDCNDLREDMIYLNYVQVFYTKTTMMPTGNKNWHFSITTTTSTAICHCTFMKDYRES